MTTATSGAKALKVQKDSSPSKVIWWMVGCLAFRRCPKL